MINIPNKITIDNIMSSTIDCLLTNSDIMPSKENVSKERFEYRDTKGSEKLLRDDRPVNEKSTSPIPTMDS
jgi:hypothetical protein